MNVHVYSGPGAATEATRQAIETFRLLLSPFYAVTTINEHQILNEPWPEETKMLVMPGGADLPFCKALDGKGNARIKQFVRKGGVYLGICAGGYYGAQHCEFERGTAMEVSGARELAFYRGSARGTAYKGFQYATNKGSRASLVEPTDGSPAFTCFYNGGSIFEGDRNAEVLLRYSTPVECHCEDPIKAAAAVYIKLGSGHVFLSGVHLEYSMESLTAPDLAPAIRNSIQADKKPRIEFLRRLLRRMGLEVSQEAAPPLVTPLHLTCLDSKLAPTVSGTMESLAELVFGGVLQDSHDSFTFCSPDQTCNVRGDKIVAVYENARLPPPGDTPYFNLGLYYQILAEQAPLMAARVSGIGRTCMYAEVVTSTSSMIDRNPQFLKLLPHGFICLASQQVAGRGRGSNVWVNPTGVLPVSGVLRVPSAQLRQSLVFVQYLVSLAVVEAVYSINPRYRELGLGIKWPNDIYIGGGHAKIGGILVTVTFVNNTFVLVFGCGTNVNNLAPTTSLNSMISELNQLKGYTLPPIRQEDLLARMLTRLDEMWVVFLDLGFAPFEQRYYEHWLHQNKIVTLDQYNNQRAMVKGITIDTGMLLVQALDSQDRPIGVVYELQPDGNSFDMLKGLIKKKT